MAVIVMHKPTGKHYVLIGTGYGAYRTKSPSFIGGTLFPHEEQGEIPAAAVTDENGGIKWLLTEELQVVEIEGQDVASLFERVRIRDRDAQARAEAQHLEHTTDLCPACGARVKAADEECPSCGLVFL